VNGPLVWTAGLGAGAGVLGVVTALLHALARPVWEVERYARDVADATEELRANLEVGEQLDGLGGASAEVRRRVLTATAPASPPPVSHAPGGPR
jgi:hypothetical protein